MSWLRNYGMSSALSDRHPSRTSTALVRYLADAVAGLLFGRYGADQPHGFDAGYRAVASASSGGPTLDPAPSLGAASSHR